MNKAFHRISKWAVFLYTILFLFAGKTSAQAPAEKPKEKVAGDSQEKAAEPPNAAQIELLETKYRFETNGDSRKEVHALVKINSELGVRQFARLNFDYNRSFQSVEIPLAHITHANGGTSDILPSAITDAPNPAVEKFPAYHDVRVKSVRILGLQPGDSLEYRVITTTTNPPLAPDFWLSHSFDRTGVTSKQLLELDLPSSTQIQMGVRPDLPSAAIADAKEGNEARHTYRWDVSSLRDVEFPSAQPDVAMSSLSSWVTLAEKLRAILTPSNSEISGAWKKSAEITDRLQGQEKKLHAVYAFVSQKVVTVDLPLGATRFRTRNPDEILAAGYATSEDKFALFSSMLAYFGSGTDTALTGATGHLADQPPSPFPFTELLTIAYVEPKSSLKISDANVPAWLDPTLEVAPFGAIPAKLRGKEALTGRAAFSDSPFGVVPSTLPFASTQQVKSASILDSSGALTTKVNYALRGDSELLLRVTFHQTPPEKQNEIAQYLALSDGFRGKVTSVKTSDPYETDKPFEVEYELTQEKFVDWSKKPMRIPALLPLPGLPELPKKSSGDSKIELGPPLDIELAGTLRLPPGMTAQAPAGTSAKRDYATFTSQYSAKENVIHFSRHLNFLLSEIPVARAVDLGAFLHAVQSDQSQLFVIDKPDSVPPAKPK